MVIDYWTRFGTSPLWTALTSSISVLFFLYAAAMILRIHAVSGTRRAYLALTTARTLCLPLFAGFVFSLAMDVFIRHWFDALCDGYLGYAMLRDWNRLKDSDDWWKGKGTKLKKKLRSMFTASSPAAAGAGA